MVAGQAPTAATEEPQIAPSGTGLRYKRFWRALDYLYQFI
jgi:hypothetical protein